MNDSSPTIASASEVAFSRSGGAGIVTLDRPRAVNALTLDMVEAILAQLSDWAEDDAVRAVVIEGRGEKGLCAGGDVRAVREAVLAGDTAKALRFFAAEYDMNRMIATYEKPVIAIQTGIVMGGGIGVSSHARYRLAAHGAQFAMPEGAIGFFADVGVNALLAQAARAPALAFILTGVTVEASDAMALGLTDLAVADSEIAHVRRRVIEATEADEIDTAIASVLQAHSAVSGEAPFCRLAESLSDCFAGDDVGVIVEMLDLASEDGDVGAATLVARLRAHCPTSLAVNLAAHRKARRERRLGSVLDTDYRLARAMIARTDFSEGVRARLIDKTEAPEWSPNRLHLVDRQAVADWVG